MSGARDSLAWVIAGALLLVGARVFTTGMADQSAHDTPSRALGWRSAQPEALVRNAATQRAIGNEAAADELAHRAVAADPLDGRGYAELARLAQARGDLPSAEALMQIAVHRAPRDATIRDWRMRDALVGGRIDDALAEIDAMLRADPEVGKSFFPALIALLDDPHGVDTLARTLATAPAWRAAFWSALCASKAPIDGASKLVEALDRSAKPLDTSERTQWLERLLAAGRWGEAFPLWVESLAPERRTRIGNVYDGSFEWPAQNGGFGWRFGYVPGADISRRGTPGESYLHIAFDDRRVPFDHVHELLVLAPGAYRAQGRVRAPDLRTERGMQWYVVCAGGDGQRLGESERITHTNGWQDFAFDVTVPATGCEAQWLGLRLAARIPAEQHVDGTIDFTALRIDRSDHVAKLGATPRNP
ncbi:MAG TPA: hypothetical protein VFB32_04010 [Rudaea sp.]|nr:hypothetical protein [Rudaea sp.]